MCDSVTLKSECGTSLSFIIKSRKAIETTFEVSCARPNFKAKRIVKSSRHDPPTGLFSKMAKNWRGWDGQFEWSDPNGVLKMISTMDSTGHSYLRVYIIDTDTAFATSLKFNAGELDNIAKEVSDAFEQDL